CSDEPRDIVRIVLVVSVKEDKGLGLMLAGVQPSASNCKPLSKVAGVVDYVSARQGGRFRRIVGRPVVDDHNLARELSSFQHDGANCRTFVEGEDDHEDY